VDTASLRALFSKPYGAPAPTEAQWRAMYADDVHFQDPTQNKQGIAASLTPGAMAVEGDTAFVEWEMGLKIKGIEFIYPGTTRLRFNSDGKIVDHRDYFDFVGPTFEPVPVAATGQWRRGPSSCPPA